MYRMKTHTALVLLISLFLSQDIFAQNTDAKAREEVKNGLSGFVKNFARVEENGKSFYIDTTGQYAFDRIYGADTFGTTDAIEQYRYELKKDPDGIPQTVFAVFREKDNKWGILAPDGKWILKPGYDLTDEVFRKYGKPRFNLDSDPPQLQQLSQFGNNYFLDGMHYAVKQGENWGVYNSKTREMTVPATYDRLDYCGGCGRKSDYVYAQKDGKWGIVSFNNKVLVPFWYEHTPMNMRSDEWVMSFKRNGAPVVVYIPTAKEFKDFTDAELIRGGLLRVRKDGKTGLVNAEGTELLPCVYDDIEEPFNLYSKGELPYLLLHRDGQTGLADLEGNIVLDTHFDDISIQGPYFVVSVEGMYSLLDRKGRQLLDPVYSDISSIKITHPDGPDTWIIVVKEGELYGFFDPETGLFVPPEFQNVKNASSGFSSYNKDPSLGLVEVTHEGKVGMYDLDGQVVMPVRYDKWDHYDKKYPALLIVENNEKKGLYDLGTGREIISPAYGHIGKPESGNLLRVSTRSYGGGKNGVYTIKGKQVLPVGYSKVAFLDNGWIQAETGDEYKNRLKGIFDAEGNTILPIKYDEITPLTSETWLLRSKGGYNLFRTKTQKSMVLDYPMVWKTGAPEVLLVAKDSVAAQLYNIEQGKAYPEKYSTYHYNGQKDTTYTRSLIGKFSSGLARVDKMINGKLKVGFIDTQAKTVIPFEYDVTSEEFKHGITLLGKEGADNRVPPVYGYADSTGQIIVSLKYHYYSNTDIDFKYITKDHLFLVEQDSENTDLAVIGLADHQGQVLLSPGYSAVYPFENEQGFLLKKGGRKYINGSFYSGHMPPEKFGMAGLHGKIIVPVELDDVILNRSMRHYETRVDLSFPVLCKKDGQWQYYTRNGTKLSRKGGEVIEFTEN
ncbi:WG repeat-containing protein [Sinomicrobium weinanense]|uniref:WG repeat-containing protein n=1 Tax=Sinomicrobium weinanense TaxID=2842200 RepID=A0A926JTN5_9FLAO|nr:WG repeat-containing protein [Sinomicrobium weinanense]MBC9797114.1 WG repeat-containing protein [Sinomicrobium weinanense]MBU3124810.1 WG repeat-containing protein [Sinomicrobium weinanense]